jgi:hypothetical protein
MFPLFKETTSSGTPFLLSSPQGRRFGQSKRLYVLDGSIIKNNSSSEEEEDNLGEIVALEDPNEANKNMKVTDGTCRETSMNRRGEERRGEERILTEDRKKHQIKRNGGKI